MGLGYCQSLRVDSQGNALDDWPGSIIPMILILKDMIELYNTGIDEIKTYLVIRNTISMPVPSYFGNRLMFKLAMLWRI